MPPLCCKRVALLVAMLLLLSCGREAEPPPVAPAGGGEAGPPAAMEAPPEASRARLVQLVDTVFEVRKLPYMDHAAEKRLELARREAEAIMAGLLVLPQGDPEKLPEAEARQFFQLLDDVLLEMAPELHREVNPGGSVREEPVAEPSLEPKVSAVDGEAAGDWRLREMLNDVRYANRSFLNNDLDGNGVRDVWVADVAGLYRLQTPGTQFPIEALRWELARADPAPRSVQGLALTPWPESTGQPYDGCWLRMVPRYRTPAGDVLRFDDGSGRRRVVGEGLAYAVVAEPVEGEGTGMLMLIEGGPASGFWRKATGGQAVEVCPADPAAEGWERLP